MPGQAVRPDPATTGAVIRSRTPLSPAFRWRARACPGARDRPLLAPILAQRGTGKSGAGERRPRMTRPARVSRAAGSHLASRIRPGPVPDLVRLDPGRTRQDHTRPGSSHLVRTPPGSTRHNRMPAARTDLGLPTRSFPGRIPDLPVSAGPAPWRQVSRRRIPGSRAPGRPHPGSLLPGSLGLGRGRRDQARSSPDQRRRVR